MSFLEFDNNNQYPHLYWLLLKKEGFSYYEDLENLYLVKIASKHRAY